MTLSFAPFALIALGILTFSVVLLGLIALARDRRRRVEREAALHHLAQTLSGAVSVEEVAQHAAKYALVSTRAVSAHVERARDGVVEVIAGAGERAPPLGHRVNYPDSFASSVGGATEPAIRMTAGAVGRSAAAYLHSCYGCSGLAVPLSVEEGPHRAEGALVLLSDGKGGDMPRIETAYARALGDLVTAAMRRTLLVEREHHARMEAESAVRDRDQVLRVVSHDLKNPLHTIGMVAQLLLDLPLSDGERHKQLEILQRTVDRMNRLVRDLLDATRVQSGHAIPLVPEPVDVVPLIADAIDSFRDQARDHGQRLIGEVTEGARSRRSGPVASGFLEPHRKWAEVHSRGRSR
jgi:K+-sensing histidine kinase KdpD